MCSRVTYTLASFALLVGVDVCYLLDIKYIIADTSVAARRINPIANHTAWRIYYITRVLLRTCFYRTLFRSL